MKIINSQEPKIIKKIFYLSADYCDAWGWVILKYSDGKSHGSNIACGLTEEIEGTYINRHLLKIISKWQAHFEVNEESDDFDWDTFNKMGLRLAILLKPIISNVFDEVRYGFATEDKDYNKIYQNISVIID